MWCEVVNRSSQGCSWQACGRHGSCLRLLGTSISMQQPHKGWSTTSQGLCSQLMSHSWVMQLPTRPQTHMQHACMFMQQQQQQMPCRVPPACTSPWSRTGNPDKRHRILPGGGSR